MDEQNEGHRHVPIPEIIQGRAPRNIGIRPGTNRCIECGDIVPDHPDTGTRWQAFLMREMEHEERDSRSDV